MNKNFEEYGYVKLERNVRLFLYELIYIDYVFFFERNVLFDSFKENKI